LISNRNKLYFRFYSFSGIILCRWYYLAAYYFCGWLF